MDLEYDRKFEEMKKYIPFLESMIKRLESTNNGAKNPRKAQLDKIKSLRYLLLDKKKRMKMENLLKCEQVLVNLYAKVEQRDLITDDNEDYTDKTQKDKSDLNTVRNKLKSVVSKLQDDVPETLPEIARATNTEVVCTPGSKEPALFQRRPNKASPPHQSTTSRKDDSSLSSKRHYTRVLMSPERKKQEWLANSDANTEKPLFSRRSPRKSPRRYSPLYKKERKKSSKLRSKPSQQSKDLNITLKVPEESLGSLNTKDILSRIINCSDSDVDIDTLRGLRSQILGELKQTGTKDDISDLILKSYKNKEKHSSKKDEVEEGELSDSESEVIENIYGSLVVVNPGEGNSNTNKISTDKKHPRKIQICLVINSEKEKDSKINDQTLKTTLDITDFEPYTEPNKSCKDEKPGDKIIKDVSKVEVNSQENQIKSPVRAVEDKRISTEKETTKTDNKGSINEKMQIASDEKSKPSNDTFKLNFYQPCIENKAKRVEESLVKQNSSESSNEDSGKKKDETATKPVEINKKTRNPDSCAKTEIKKDSVSEIDILQALKKEILGETTTVPMSEAITPPLHQPKITKVASCQQTVSKKRISIEKYKQKSVPSSKQSLFNPVKQHSLSKDDNSKKQSLKLTEKECERFNFPVNVSPVDSSEEDISSLDSEYLHENSASKSPDSKNIDKSHTGFEFHRSNSAPKSPDHDDFADTGIRPPVIIPSDPIKNVVPNTKADIDMRTLVSLASPIPFDGSKKSMTSPLITCDKVLESTWNEKGNNNENINKPEFRVRTESNQPVANDSANSYYPKVPLSMSSNIPSLMSLNIGSHMTSTQNPIIVSGMNPIMTPILNTNIPLIGMAPNMTPTILSGLAPNMTPNMNASMTPSRILPSMSSIMTPILTPNARSYEMTPRPNFDNDDYTKQKHVYAPIFPTFEPHNFTEADTVQLNKWESNESTKWEDGNRRSTSMQRDVDYHRKRNDIYKGDKMECPSTPNPSFGRMECPSTPNPSFGRMECPSTPNPSFGRMDCPPTPNPSFGRMECPSTPNPSFGRMECPPTPNHSFGRMECPSTPNPSFGRMECPLTPNPSFGRIETPMTPIHSFGRSDCSMTPSHSFGRPDSNMTPSNVFGRGDFHHNTSSFSHKYMKSQDPRLNRSCDYDKYQGRNDDRNHSYLEDDQNLIENTNRYRNKIKSFEQISSDRIPRRETSVGRSITREYETDQSYHKDYYYNDYQYRRDRYKRTDDVSSRRNYRERSIGRLNPSEDAFPTKRERGMANTYTREGSIEKPIVVQSHTGRSFNIDTSFNRTFQEIKSSSLNTSFDARRQRASSVGRSLYDCKRKDVKQTTTRKNNFELGDLVCKTMQFRRACSVGRDLQDYNANKNFKDIKADLRSCKFSNYDFNLRDGNNKNKSRINSANEKVNSSKYHSSCDKRVNNKKITKSAEHQISRDPRKRERDYDLNIKKMDDSSKYSPRKNYRDPRMRRDIDVKNLGKEKDKDRSLSTSRNKNYGIVYSHDNIAKGRILASAAGVKNFKIPKIKRPTEDKEIETNQNETDIKKEVSKKEHNANIEQSEDVKKASSKQTSSDNSSVVKRRDMKNTSEDVAVKVDKLKSKENNSTLTNKFDDKEKSQDAIPSVKLMSDNCERRITRSALKDGTYSKEISATSPVKKLRRIKKSFVYDSDSDSQENRDNHDNTKRNIDQSKNLQNTERTEKQKDDGDVEKGSKVGKYSDTKVTDKLKHVESVNSRNENNSTTTSPVEKNLLDNMNQKSTPAMTNESCEEQNDSLDISFGVDDELFSDNITSGSVLDNINALIADLDQDIEAPKINDFNDKFISNIVGSISSHDASIPLDENQADCASDISLKEKLDFVIDIQNSTKYNIDKISNNPDNTNNVDVIKIKNVLEHDSIQLDNMLATQSKCKEINEKIVKDSVTSEIKTIDKTGIQDKLNNGSNESAEVENLNVDAVVSTTAYDEKADEIPKISHSMTLNSFSSINPIVPDSTINSNENVSNTNNSDLQESFPDSTNELTSDMNITSTHNSNNKSFKEQSSSTYSDNLPRIDTISKLLSMLEDKNKIKELLTLLGSDSGENEKIKKKLEKLSEIVSDDDEVSRESHKDLKTHEKQILVQENLEKKKDIIVERSLLANDKNESVADNKILEKELENQKSNIQSDGESKFRNVGISDNQLLTDNIKDLELGNTVDIINANKDVVIDSADTDDNEVQGNETGKNKDLQHTLQDVELVLADKEKENQDKDALPAQLKPGKGIARKTKITKRGRSRLAKKLLLNKDKRVTRSEAGLMPTQIPSIPKKPSRELLKLQEDIRDMFISEDILNATGIRMCRLAKLVDDKQSKCDTQISEVEPKPIVVLENIKGKISDETIHTTEKTNKKKITKSKPAVHNEISVGSESMGKPKYKPGPKSKTKRQEDDSYIFENESIAESNKSLDSRDQNINSDSDSVSTKSCGSSELIIESKKKTKRKKRGWQLGVIRKKGIKHKSVVKHTEPSVSNDTEVKASETKDSLCDIPDFNCFTDKSYCFHKNVNTYMCRLCGYRGNDIVPHYKKHHPHSEIPLSRLNPVTAKEAIEQCENMNLQSISKIQTLKYVCRFCFQEFNKLNTALETFFWHVVSVHTGEYKHLCSECINVTRCPFHLDIPPPPKNLKGQLIGYICGRCNFTQVSLENLKTHVIVRHDDEQTEVYSINLGEIPRKILKSLITRTSESSVDGLRVLRSTRSNQSVTEQSDERSDMTDSTDRIAGLDATRDNHFQEVNTQKSPKIGSKKIQSKFIFENDEISDTSSYSKNDEIIKASIKLEHNDDTQDSHRDDIVEEAVESALPPPESEPECETQPDLQLELEAQPESQSQLEPESQPEPEKESTSEQPQQALIDKIGNEHIQTEFVPSPDVLDYPHFKVKLSSSGIKEYICCINGIDNHYKTTLLISFKKHVQLKHPENWDGYCFLCKVIVTGQGKHKFKDCLQHFLDKHIDNFPILDEPEQLIKDTLKPTTSTPVKDLLLPKSYINVRPLSELISAEQIEAQIVSPAMPKIQSVVSLGTPNETINSKLQEDEKVYNYEEAQAEVMTKKHRVVLEAMLTPKKLIQVFKCAGRFCSYTTDDAEEALLHASTHQKIGGECSLRCAYCDFDSSGNAIDLVMHVFKNYSHCSYACSKCFYRAAVGRLVYAHIKRVHTEMDADKVSVLSSTTVAKDNTKDDVMSRDAAVLYYVCNNRDPDEGGICQFKSHVLTKFREHLQMKHASDEEYSCYMCNISTSSAKLLAQHLKSHGLRIYQCCRCLFGADSESELMAHASEKHPLKQPKAYLRIITTKGGSSEVRVLPLAVLSKSSVETTVVTSNTDRESPIKQAERSIDLEKLIGHTNLMIESMSTITNAATIEPIDVTANENQIQLENELALCTTSKVESENVSPAVLTLLKDPQDKSVVKTEPVKTSNRDAENKTSEIPSVATASTPPDPDVVCLDSDEDSSRQNIIDLSGEDVLAESNSSNKQDDGTDIRFPRPRLYKCSKCSIVSKSEGMFKRHIISCFSSPNEQIKCAYCSYVTAASGIIVHYNDSHLESTVPYVCAICNGKFVSLMIARKHMKLIHNETSTMVKSKKSPTGDYYLIDSDFKKRQAPKRKMSSETGNKSSESTAKIKKYGPQDVEKLPINPILDDLVYCSLCEFSTKVRLNMVRHLQLHAEQQPVPRTAPVNPVPHLESNEKHFDKMLNLASSSIKNSNKTNKDGNIILTEYLSLEAASIYPKYVADRHRYTCGAKDCSYISVNESMFKIHWETLHAGTNDYHCVHCPPHQHLDTSKPLTAVRIIAHLKMHDIKLYACSSCTFYHHTRKLIEKHLKEVHYGKLVIVREDGLSLPPTPPVSIQSSIAPTMDLKPWQCGLCMFKSMLRAEVIEHCGKFHQSKMQFKCMYCGFRTSNIENISKHQSKQHPDKKEEVFYFYYQEGSVPDEADGIARWQKQSQKSSEPEIKSETDMHPPDSVPISNQAPAKPSNPVYLDIVKKEIIEPETNVEAEAIEDLCDAFGQFCDPNGLKYKCSLCKVIIEDTKEAMQSHLYEELQYRKWGCAVCSYKAFHKPGLQQHVQTEHRHSREAKEPIELQVDRRIETWIAKLLEHQTIIIERNKENLAKQKAEILRANPGPGVKVIEKPVELPSSVGAKTNISMAELEKHFGPFGVPSNMNYTCPKCNISARTEAVMQEHLESELNKIRWCCNICSDTFQTYHEAQFHCRSIHPGQSSRPVEAARDVSLRAAWVTAVLRVQKLSMSYKPVTESNTSETLPQPIDISPENSLLVVRYEEKVPTPEEQMKLKTKSDNGEDKISTDDPEKKKTEYECKYCNATYKYESFYQCHVLKHYGLKPFTCPYCPHTDHKKVMDLHIKNEHPNRSTVYVNTPIPDNPPVQDYLKNTTATTPSVVNDIETKIICLVCEEAMTRVKSLTHYHDNVRPQFGVKGSVVYRCWTCLTLHKSNNDFSIHHKQFHGNEKKNSSFYKLHDDSRSLFCSLCNQNFDNMCHYRTHQQNKHSLKRFVAAQLSDSAEVIDLDDEVESGGKRKAEDTVILPLPKRVARKSTTKLPNVIAVARKSTTKLPFNVPCDDEEYSYYGTKPSMENLENVTTLMPFYNTFVPFKLKKLSEIIKIHPVVLVKDCIAKK